MNSDLQAVHRVALEETRGIVHPEAGGVRTKEIVDGDANV
jgi:hypothetical protein